MKKLLSFVLLLLLSINAFSQRCAVMEFKAGAGISQADVDGISAIFITYFRPAGYTMVERTQIDRVISEQGFQRSSLTENQMVRIGRILNVSNIVVGDINIVMGQYNVDARVIDVESGVVVATEGATFAQSSSYRSTMQSVAQKLASKIALSQGYTSSSVTSSAPKKRTNVEVLYGYLKVFPNELGDFSSEPTNVIDNINYQVQYGYNNWRIPTNEELSLLRANNYLSDGVYMTRESTRGRVLLVTDGADYSTIQAEEKANEIRRQEEARRSARWNDLCNRGYVDLGLPSGTFWKSSNEESRIVSQENAMYKYYAKLPTKADFEELAAYCTITWLTSGCKVVGPNGQSIYLPAQGYKFFSHSTNDSASYILSYWTSTPAVNSDYSGGYYCWFWNEQIKGHTGIAENPQGGSHSVRLVEKL